MHFYVDGNGRLHFLSDADLANGGESLLPDGCKEITVAEADAIIAASFPP